MTHKSKTKTGYTMLIIFSVFAIIASILILVAIKDSGVSDGIFRPALMLIGGFLTLGFSISAINQENKNGPEQRQLTLVLIGSAILFGAMVFEMVIDFSDTKRAYDMVDGIPTGYFRYSSTGNDAVSAIKKLYAGEILTLISTIGIGISAIGAAVAFQNINSHHTGAHLASPTKASTNTQPASKNTSSEDKLKKAFMDGIISAQEYEKKLKENKKK